MVHREGEAPVVKTPAAKELLAETPEPSTSDETPPPSAADAPLDEAAVSDPAASEPDLDDTIE